MSLATGLGVIEIALRNGRIVPAATVATGTEANNMLDSFIVFLVLAFSLKRKYVSVILELCYTLEIRWYRQVQGRIVSNLRGVITLCFIYTDTRVRHCL